MFAAPRFDPELIRRYDCHGPRYTSYPTATQFRTDFDVGRYRTAALLSNERTTPLSLYVHVPFCASPCFYCGCSKVITRSTTEGNRYVNALKREIEIQAPLFHHNRRIEQLHFGGGTPTFLTLFQLESILKHLRREFSYSPAACESSIEIDPRTVSSESVAGLASLGFNRISLGVQDFDHEVQMAVNRIQGVTETQAIVDSARRHGVNAINFDLIYGLPKQTLESFSRTLDTVVAMRPTRVASYGYAHMPANFKAQRQINAGDLPSAATRLELLKLTVERLSAAGYLYIGMDHFALPEDPLAIAMAEGKLQRNFQGYSSHVECDLVGLGVSSIGKVGSAYAQNTKSLPEYYERLENHQLAIQRGLQLSRDDRLRGRVIQSILCQGTVDIDAIERDHCIEFATYFANELECLAPLHADGLLDRVGQRIVVSDKGRFLARNIAMVFDAYLGQQSASVYSKAI